MGEYVVRLVVMLKYCMYHCCETVEDDPESRIPYYMLCSAIWHTSRRNNVERTRGISNLVHRRSCVFQHGNGALIHEQREEHPHLQAANWPLLIEPGADTGTHPDE